MLPQRIQEVNVSLPVLATFLAVVKVSLDTLHQQTEETVLFAVVFYNHTDGISHLVPFLFSLQVER